MLRLFHDQGVSYCTDDNVIITPVYIATRKSISWTGIAQAVWRLATGWTVRGSNPGGGRYFRHPCRRPEAHPASCKMGTWSFTGVKPKGGGADHKTPSSVEVKEIVQLQLCLLRAFITGYRVTFTLYFYTKSWLWRQNIAHCYDLKILHTVFILYLKHQHSKVQSQFHSTDTSEQNGCQITSE
jgi:hypothetical protein